MRAEAEAVGEIFAAGAFTKLLICVRKRFKSSFSVPLSVCSNWMAASLNAAWAFSAGGAGDEWFFTWAEVAIIEVVENALHDKNLLSMSAMLERIRSIWYHIYAAICLLALAVLEVALSLREGSRFLSFFETIFHQIDPLTNNF